MGRPARRLTIRARLTLTFAALVTVSGAILIGIVWAYMTFTQQLSVITVSSPPGSTAEPTPADLFVGSAQVTSVTAYDFLSLLVLVSLAALVVVAVISGVIGWLVSGRLLRPLKTINDAAIVAGSGSLDHRVALDGPRDELRDLGDTFNSMLDALQRSFQAHQRFAANASHELRTPLATIQTMIDVTLADPDADTATLRRLADRIRTVNQENAQIVTALLDLADLDQVALRTEPVDLGVVVAGALRATRDEAAGKHLTVTHEPHGPALVLGDPTLLRHCVTNLVQNAVRHNVDHGTILIRVEGQGGAVALTIANSGTVLPPDLIPALAEPFVRGSGRLNEPGRGQRGHGLGLAIATSIAAAHHGELSLSAHPGGGLIATLELPAADVKTT